MYIYNVCSYARVHYYIIMSTYTRVCYTFLLSLHERGTGLRICYSDIVEIQLHKKVYNRSDRFNVLLTKPVDELEFTWLEERQGVSRSSKFTRGRKYTCARTLWFVVHL